MSVVTQRAQEIESKDQYELQMEEIDLLKKYMLGPYDDAIKKLEESIKKGFEEIDDIMGVEESDIGYAPKPFWDLNGDKAMMKQDVCPLLIGQCNKIIEPKEDDNEQKYMVNIPNTAKYVVDLDDNMARVDVQEGDRVGIYPSGDPKYKHKIRMSFPEEIDSNIRLMVVDEKPNIIYNDIGGCNKAIEQLKEIVELPLLYPERFNKLKLSPPKGAIIYGPPGVGKTLTVKAIANKTNAAFINVNCLELNRGYIGQGAKLIRDLFKLARTKEPCILFFDEIDSIGSSRNGNNEDNESERTMMELLNQLDGFSSRGNIKVIMATNRPDTLDKALIRPGRIDRKIEFGLPNLNDRIKIFKIVTKNINCDKNNIRWELLARKTPNTTGAEIKYIATEAGMFAIRERKRMIKEEHFMMAINKVTKTYKKFSSTPTYMVYN